MLDPLTGLDGDYKILGELHRTSGTTTYLARNLHLLRDVTVTVVPVAIAGRAALTQISNDTRLIIGLRNPNIIPVLEGRWLGRNAFAIIRARVRGTTLAELLSNVGTVPLLRVHATLEQIYPTLVWARENGIGMRHVSPEWVVFQQGSGRALLAFDVPPASMAGAEGEVEGTEDVRMFGTIARVMLSGKSDAGEQKTPLDELRPDLPPKITVTADALATGRWTGVDDISQFLSALSSAAGIATDPAASPPRGTTSISPPRATMSITSPPASIAPPLAHPHADSITPEEPVPEAAAPPPPQVEPEQIEAKAEPPVVEEAVPEKVEEKDEIPSFELPPLPEPTAGQSNGAEYGEEEPDPRVTAPRRIVSPESGVPRVIPPLPGHAPVKPGGTIERAAVRPPMAASPPLAPTPAPPAPPPPPMMDIEKSAVESAIADAQTTKPGDGVAGAEPYPRSTPPTDQLAHRPGPRREEGPKVDSTPLRLVDNMPTPLVDKSLSLILEPPSARLTNTTPPPPMPPVPPPPTASPTPPPTPPRGLNISHIEEPNAPPAASAESDGEDADDEESMPRTLERSVPQQPPEPRRSGPIVTGRKQFDLPAKWPIESTATSDATPPSTESDEPPVFIAKTTTDPRGRVATPGPRGSRAIGSTPPTASPSVSDASSSAPSSSAPPPAVEPPRATPPVAQPPVSRSGPSVPPARAPSTPMRQSAVKAAPVVQEIEPAPVKPRRPKPRRRIQLPIRGIVTTLVVVGVVGGGVYGGKTFVDNRRAAADSARAAKERADSIEIAEAAKLAPRPKKGAKRDTSGDAPSVGPNGDFCNSPSRVDQQHCFTVGSQQADTAVTRILTSLVATLRRQSHIGAADADPPIVDRLRGEQRAWVATRDRECPALGSSMLAGRDRAQCFVERAAKRAKDLQQQLEAIPPT